MKHNFTRKELLRDAFYNIQIYYKGLELLRYSDSIISEASKLEGKASLLYIMNLLNEDKYKLLLKIIRKKKNDCLIEVLRGKYN